MGYVYRVKVKVMNSCHGSHDSNGGHPYSGCKDLKVIKTRPLIVAFSNKSALVSLHRAICIPLDLENPLGANDLLPFGLRDQFPSAISAVCIQLL